MHKFFEYFTYGWRRYPIKTIKFHYYVWRTRDIVFKTKDLTIAQKIFYGDKSMWELYYLQVYR